MMVRGTGFLESINSYRGLIPAVGRDSRNAVIVSFEMVVGGNSRKSKEEILIIINRLSIIFGDLKEKVNIARGSKDMYLENVIDRKST